MINKRKLLPYISSFIIAIFVSLLINVCLVCDEKYPIVSMDWGYELSINGSVYENVEPYDVYKHLDRLLKYGDVVSLTTTLPDLGDIPFPALLFRSRYSAMEVYVDGKVIYDFGHELVKKRHFIGKMYHFIPLPCDYAGN